MLAKQHGEPAKDGIGTLLSELNQLEKQIKGERIVSIKEKVQRNGEILQSQVSAVMSAISSKDSLQQPSEKLSARIDHPSYKFSGFSRGSGNRDHINCQGLSAASIKISYMERLPPYKPWIHFARMAFEEHGLTEEVIKIVSQSVGGTTSEIQERYKSLKEKNMGEWASILKILEDMNLVLGYVWGKA